MEIDRFAGMRVSDYEAAKPRYEKLLGSEPTSVPHAELAGGFAPLQPYLS